MKHAQVVQSTCKKAIEVYSLLKSNSLTTALETIEVINQFERDADSLQDELADLISRGLLPPDIQEDLFRIVRSIDSAANWVKTASKNIHLLIELDMSFPIIIIEYQHQLSELIYQSVVLVVEMIQYLGKNDKKVVEKRFEVEKLERAADEVYYKAKEQSLILGKKANSSVVFLALDTAKSLENASDSCAAASDYLYTIVTSGNLR